MRVVGLDNKQYNLDLRHDDYVPDSSSYHKEAKKLISDIFISYRVLEEVFLPGCSTNLYLDFFIPLLRLAIEVQGQQHEVYIPYFHKNKLGQVASIKRDREKKEWCNLNNFTLIELSYNESIEEWKKKLIHM